MGPSGWTGPALPHPSTPPARLPSGCFSSDTWAPRACTASIEARTSAESSTPSKREVPSAIAENKMALCEIDLSPGTVTQPSSDPASGRITFGSDMKCAFLPV